MALTGEEKEMRMSGSLGYHSLDQNIDHTVPPNIQDQSTGGGSGAAPVAGVAPHNSSAGSNKFNKVTSSRARYRECLKNHAANIGGNVTDGCGEFMPSGEEGTLEALKCAACNCHRNFHRKELPNNGDNNNNNPGIMVVHPLQLPQPLPTPIPSMNHHHHHHHQHRGRSIWTTMPPQPVKMAFGASGGSGATDSSSEELNFNTYHHQQATSVPPQQPFLLAKKRFRTKFSQEQKEKMLEFAEKLGWRIPREDDTEVQSFCSQVGVKRQVFKVWMHNNKNPSAKKNINQEDQQP